MVEANKSDAPAAATRNVWKEQEAKAGKKRKHQRAFGNNGKTNWSQKRDNKRVQ